MTAYRFVTLTCDGCGEIHDAGVERTFAGARKSARREGWTVPDKGRDLCPACSGTHFRVGDFGFVRNPPTRTL